MAMQEDTRQPTAERLDARQDDLPIGSGAVPLSLSQWLACLGVAVLLTYLIPVLWTRIEPLKLGSDYRVPFRLSHDYWMIRRYVRRAARENRTLVLGDSVVWGHYVGKGQTLSHYLNQLSGGEHFTNLGVDGTHPAAMVGLIQQYEERIDAAHGLQQPGCLEGLLDRPALYQGRRASFDRAAVNADSAQTAWIEIQSGIAPVVLAMPREGDDAAVIRFRHGQMTSYLLGPV